MWTLRFHKWWCLSYMNIFSCQLYIKNYITHIFTCELHSVVYAWPFHSGGLKCHVETKHGAEKSHEFASLGANSTFLDVMGNFEMSIKTSIWRWLVSPMSRDCYWPSRQGLDSNLWPFVACHPPSLSSNFLSSLCAVQSNTWPRKGQNNN